MTEENDVPLVPLETPTIPLEPSEQIKVWLSIEKRGFVVGYGSSETSDSICLNKSDLPDEFETYFSFYRLDENLELVYDDTLAKEISAIQEEASKLPTDKEKIELLEKENESLKLEILETKQRALMTEEAILDLATMIISV